MTFGSVCSGIEAASVAWVPLGCVIPVSMARNGKAGTRLDGESETFVVFVNSAGNTNLGGGGQIAVASTMAVRRLTPREVERLFGFPDNYTLIPYRGKPVCDGPRYRALGNSMAVPVMRWLARRIQLVDSI